jgi:hypothetical protein
MQLEAKVFRKRINDTFGTKGIVRRSKRFARTTGKEFAGTHSYPRQWG